MKRNPIARALASGHLKQQKIRPKKGKGSFRRKKDDTDADRQVRQDRLREYHTRH